MSVLNNQLWTGVRTSIDEHENQIQVSDRSGMHTDVGGDDCVVTRDL